MIKCDLFDKEKKVDIASKETRKWVMLLFPTVVANHRVPACPLSAYAQGEAL